MKSKNIVVVDDNKSDLLMAKYVIQRMGYIPILLESGKKLIATLQSMSVAAIVLDYEMPEMSGLDILKNKKNWFFVVHSNYHADGEQFDRSC